MQWLLFVSRILQLKYLPNFRRGHDSTGVTDRVVNQLLTELDGVEGLQVRISFILFVRR